jgi:hypothetical protein
MTTATVNTTSDDQYGVSDGGWSKTSTGIALGNINVSDATTRAWIPFVVNIPNAVDITSAIFKVRAENNYSGTTVKIKIGCEAADNPSAPTNKTTLYARTMTTAYLTNNNVSAWTAGTEYSFDVTTAVQEVLDGAGWASGNTMAILIFDNGSSTDVSRVFASEENVSYAQAILEIEYVYGGNVIITES